MSKLEKENLSLRRSLWEQESEFRKDKSEVKFSLPLGVWVELHRRWGAEMKSIMNTMKELEILVLQHVVTLLISVEI
jgi:hypothetical protein